MLSCPPNGEYLFRMLFSLMFLECTIHTRMYVLSSRLPFLSYTQCIIDIHLRFTCDLVDQLLVASERILAEFEPPANALRERLQTPSSQDLIRMIRSIVGSLVLLVKLLHLYITRTVPLVDDR